MNVMMTKLVNMDGTFRYTFQDIENDYCSYDFKKKSKKDYKFCLVFFARKGKGAVCNSLHWRAVALGNNAKTMLNSWKSIYFYGDLKVIEIR